MFGIMARQRYRAPSDHFNDLSAVVTIAEAMTLYHRGRSTIRYAIDSGRVAARRVGRDWLISSRSLQTLWGSPKNSR